MFYCMFYFTCDRSLRAKAKFRTTFNSSGSVSSVHIVSNVMLDDEIGTSLSSASETTFVEFGYLC